MGGGSLDRDTGRAFTVIHRAAREREAPFMKRISAIILSATVVAGFAASSATADPPTAWPGAMVDCINTPSASFIRVTTPGGKVIIQQAPCRVP
jgi:hypothetical protein